MSCSTLPLCAGVAQGGDVEVGHLLGDLGRGDVADGFGLFEDDVVLHVFQDGDDGAGLVGVDDLVGVVVPDDGEPQR